MIAPGFGGINLEDIAAPRCFEIERRLRETLDIPVFHDDQHGTAIVVLAALTNALRCVGKRLERRAHRRLRRRRGRHRDRHPAARRRAPPTSSSATARACSRATTTTLSPAHSRAGRARPTRARSAAPSQDALDGRRRLHRRLGAPASSTPSGSRAWPPTPVVFALANPDPEVDPAEAAKYAAVVATGRSDYPNQINNVLAFPGVFRGLLDARAHEVTVDMLLRAAEAIALVVTDEELNPSFIIPSVFHPDVPKAVAAAISGRTHPA